MLDRITGFSSSSRGKWIVIAVWIALVATIPTLAPALSSVTETDDEAFLPTDAESTRAVEIAEEAFPSAGTPAILVVRREGGLTDEDRAALQNLIQWLTSEEAPDNIGGVVSAFNTPAAASELVSEDGSTMTILVEISGAAGEDAFLSTVETLRNRIDELQTDAEIYVSGPAGLVADLIDIFSRIDSLLLYVTIGLIVGLLILIYRSPVVAVVPLIAVGIVFLIASGIGAFAADRFGLPVNEQSRGIMTVLLFGAGTDYNLFISSRFREELAKTQDKHEAMRLTMAAVGRAIASSAGTVVVAMLILLFADLRSTQTLGPLLALAITVMFVAAITLVPAILAILGRWAFWPFRPAYEPEKDEAESRKGLSRFWPWVADQVTGRPVWFLAGSIAFFALLSTGILRIETTYDTISSLPQDAESRQGFEVLRESFPAGSLAPTEVYVDLPEGATVDERLAAIAQVSAALAEAEGVAAVSGPAYPFGVSGGPGPDAVQQAEAALPPEVLQAIQSGEGGAQAGQIPAEFQEAAALYASSRGYIGVDKQTARIEVTLQSNPYSTTALDRIDNLRETVDEAAANAGLENANVLVGGPTATAYDTRVANNRDIVVLIPLILLAVGAILVWLLRALVAPLYLVATIILSNVATIGLAVYVFQDLLGDAGIGSAVPFYVFVFLVALGVDYNIYLMSRVREEIGDEGLLEGTRTALARTGGVITSAGIILAGTFAALLTLPLRDLYQIGFAVSVGVLIDTFISRSLIVPSVVVLLGKRNWWPGHGPQQEGKESDRPRAERAGAKSRPGRARLADRSRS